MTLSKNCLNSFNVSAESTVFCADIGTSSLKAALISSNGTVVAFSQQSFLNKNSQNRANEWLDALKKAANEFGSKIQSTQGICISGNGPTIVSENGTTLLWNDKIPSSILEIKTNSIFVPRIAAFKSLFPKEWKSSKYIFSGPEYLLYKLTGKAISILPEKRYENAYWTSNELIKFGFSQEEMQKLPEFCPPATNIGNTQAEITKSLNLLHEIPVFCGAPDFVVALIGTNTLTPGKICNRAGSSEGLNLCTNIPLVNEKIRTLPSVIPNLWNASFLISSSGRQFSNYKLTFEKNEKRTVSYNELTHFCLENPQSEGFKIMQNLAENVNEGLLILENAANQKNLVVDKTITVTGGQAKSPEWMQMKADISGKIFTQTTLADAELLGDAVLAFLGLGKFESIQQGANNMVKYGTKYFPKGVKIENL